MIYYKAVWAFLPFGFERKNGMIVLGIDPGYAIVGYGVVEMKNNRYRTLEHGAVTTKAGTDFNRRLEIIYDGIAQVLAQYHPDAVSVEKLYFSNNKTTGIGVAEARGVILLAAQKARVPVFEYTPVQVKLARYGIWQGLKAAGDGNDPPPFVPARGAEAGRHGGRARHCHLPLPCLRHGAAAVFEVTPSIWTESTEGIERTKAMFYSLTGKLVHMEPGVVAIECGGVAFKCFTSMNTQKNMPRIGETATVYTHLNVREDALDLYGFSTKSELNCYKMLTTISGVGPKAALSILSEMTPEGVAMAAASGDSKKFTKASGVGPKLAQRIVLELKDRVKKMGFTGGTLELTGTDDAGIVSASQNAEQAVQALIVLGYTQSEAAQAVAKLDGSLSTEELIRGALKSMASRF